MSLLVRVFSLPSAPVTFLGAQAFSVAADGSKSVMACGPGDVLVQRTCEMLDRPSPLPTSVPSAARMASTSWCQPSEASKKNCLFLNADDHLREVSTAFDKKLWARALYVPLIRPLLSVLLISTRPFLGLMPKVPLPPDDVGEPDTARV